MEPTTVYLAVKAAFEGGRVSYRYADKRVAAYAEAAGISKAEAWQQVRAEAGRRGDAVVVNAADLAERHPVVARAALSPLGAAALTGLGRLRRKSAPPA